MSNLVSTILAFLTRTRGQGRLHLTDVLTYLYLGLGTLLLHWAVDHITQDTVKILNVPWESADMIAFLKFHGIEPVGSQYEMIREL